MAMIGAEITETTYTPDVQKTGMESIRVIDDHSFTLTLPTGIQRTVTFNQAARDLYSPLTIEKANEMMTGLVMRNEISVNVAESFLRALSRDEENTPFSFRKRSEAGIAAHGYKVLAEIFRPETLTITDVDLDGKVTTTTEQGDDTRRKVVLNEFPAFNDALTMAAEKLTPRPR
jgi:hypothetical protein